MDDADQGAGSDQPGGIDPETQQQEKAGKHDEDGKGVLDGGGGELGGDPQHQSQGGYFDPVQEGAGPGGIADAGDQEPGSSNKDEGRQEDPHCCQDRAGNAPEQVADKGGSGEHGSRGDLPDGDGIDQLPVGQPAQALDEVGAQVGQQHMLRTVGCPLGEKPVVGVLQSAAAANRD
jgi:hypothetical protein